MAGALPDARIVVRLDTQAAQKDLKGLQDKMDRPGGEAERLRTGTQAQAILPTQKTASDPDDEERAGSTRGSVFKTFKKVRQVQGLVQRPFRELDIYAAAAVGTAAGVLGIAKAAGAPQEVIESAKKAVEAALSGMEIIQDINSRIQAAFAAISETREMTIALQLGGAEADPATLYALGMGAYEWQSIQNDREALTRRLSRSATGEAIGEIIGQAMRGLSE